MSIIYTLISVFAVVQAIFEIQKSNRKRKSAEKDWDQFLEQEKWIEEWEEDSK